VVRPCNEVSPLVIRRKLCGSKLNSVSRLYGGYVSGLLTVVSKRLKKFLMRFICYFGKIRLRFFQNFRYNIFSVSINPLNAELNPICHILILLGDLTYMSPCIVSISNKMKRYTVYLYLETALHVSGSTSTHHQERIQLYLQHLVFVTPLLLSVAIVEELEPV
jgi:hypothetical protein